MSARAEATLEFLAEAHRHSGYPQTWDELEAAIEDGSDIGWWGEAFLLDEVKRLRRALVAHHDIATLSDDAVRESIGGPCQICARAARGRLL